MEYWECPQQLADRCARGGALCTARRSPAILIDARLFWAKNFPSPPLLAVSMCPVFNPRSTTLSPRHNARLTLALVARALEE